MPSLRLLASACASCLCRLTISSQPELVSAFTAVAFIAAAVRLSGTLRCCCPKTLQGADAMTAGTAPLSWHTLVKQHCFPQLTPAHHATTFLACVSAVFCHRLICLAVQFACPCRQS